ncbi:DUF1837 domain-containing protein [Paenibacillus sp. J5C2022]|uniref:HamA C-terminal domain-containing protein n=1 Tax=Paenibacillus sp. J5C2022 TaxID=2977129 RepID=UPI0021D28783|nr:DUF1837 domain-containing protein [Paenibacillus sp. J5C2022]
MNLNWAECTRISDRWIKDYLNHNEAHNEAKINVRSYSLKFSGTQYQIMGFVEGIVDYIKQFVFPPEDISRFEAEGIDVYRRAMQYFGDTNPENDGKYGELLLYLFTESVLKAPMIAHKMTLLTNTRDQVKGGDGIFFGEYNGSNSLFIGESKIELEATTAITHALGSIERFHSNLETTSQFRHELIIASQILRQDLTVEQLDYLYDSFTPKTETYKQNNLVHPILIIYEDQHISDIEVACKGHLDGESLLSKRMKKRIPELVKNIQSKLTDHPKVKTVFLDFFFLPTTSVKQLRHTMYQAIHGVAYTSPTSKA